MLQSLFLTDLKRQFGSQFISTMPFENLNAVFHLCIFTLMMKGIIIILFSGLSFSVNAQSYRDSIYAHRVHYKQEFITDSHSPLKASDTDYLQFFAPNIKFRVVAKFFKSNDTLPFDMHTYSGKLKPYRKYGDVVFRIGKKRCQLEVYQSLDLIKKEATQDYLFLPFNDLTNYATTYAGGRYLDLALSDIKNSLVMLDFNKAYNPYCAFASGYSCPIPPVANRLTVAIKAGEKLFGNAVEEK